MAYTWMVEMIAYYLMVTIAAIWTQEGKKCLVWFIS